MSLENDPRERWPGIIAEYRALREAEWRAFACAPLSERLETLEALCSFLEEVERMEGTAVPQPFHEMLRRLHRVLERLWVPYAILGGLAAALWGIARTTVDVDVGLLAPPEQMPALLQAFDEEGFAVSPMALPRLQEGRPVQLAFTRRFSVDLRSASLQLDIQAIRRAREFVLFGIPLRFVAPEELIAYKLARWEPIDQNDVRGVLETQRDHLDLEYLEAAVRGLAEEAGLPELLSRWIHLREEILG
ncbi:hypothetical protein [Thermoflexus sp.]|uniref:hypothetical protein n=1 Tax=Thermoflexus sp. TaxID=1969742 RepID=UPI0035E4083E